MADPVPTPPAQQAKVQSTVVIEKPMSELEALRQAGWWSPMDTSVLALIALTWMTGLYWKIFGQPDTLALIALLLTTAIMLLSWLIVLVLRCARFVLRAHADIATLPEASARIAVAFLSGKTASNQ